MKTRILGLVVALALGSLIFSSLIFGSPIYVSQARAAGPSAKKDATTPAVAHTYDADAMRVQGEQRYRANCGRCHAAPQKFPPRMMATVLRHMRVRATITDEDMRLVLFYMSQ
jgi:mono/diheme cytochrome c family protein